MEEREMISRRDAVAGLGLLGGLTVLLVGTIFYRIINPSPPTKLSLDGLTIAAEVGDLSAPVAQQLPGHAPSQSVSEGSEVRPASFGQEQQASPSGGTRPSFIEPAGR